MKEKLSKIITKVGKIIVSGFEWFCILFFIAVIVGFIISELGLL
jgi:hypothetical protein